MCFLHQSYYASRADDTYWVSIVVKIICDACMSQGKIHPIETFQSRVRRIKLPEFHNFIWLDHNAFDSFK